MRQKIAKQGRARAYSGMNCTAASSRLMVDEAAELPPFLTTSKSAHISSRRPTSRCCHTRSGWSSAPPQNCCTSCGPVAPPRPASQATTAARSSCGSCCCCCCAGCAPTPLLSRCRLASGTALGAPFDGLFSAAAGAAPCWPAPPPGANQSALVFTMPATSLICPYSAAGRHSVWHVSSWKSRLLSSAASPSRPPHSPRLTRGQSALDGTKAPLPVRHDRLCDALCRRRRQRRLRRRPLPVQRQACRGSRQGPHTHACAHCNLRASVRVRYHIAAPLRTRVGGVGQVSGHGGGVDGLGTAYRQMVQPVCVGNVRSQPDWRGQRLPIAPSHSPVVAITEMDCRPAWKRWYASCAAPCSRAGRGMLNSWPGQVKEMGGRPTKLTRQPAHRPAPWARTAAQQRGCTRRRPWARCGGAPRRPPAAATAAGCPRSAAGWWRRRLPPLP